MVASIHITPEALDGYVEFDHPFTIGGTPTHPTLTDDPYGLYAPPVYHVDGEREPEIDGTGWTFVDGYSGQYRYSGPVMHASEYLGGGMARDVIETPGTYVLCVVEVLPDDEDDEPEPAGWVLLRRDEA